MSNTFRGWLVVTFTLLATVSLATHPAARAPEARPRSGEEQARRAQPRPEGAQPRAQPRRATPPPRAVPPRYHVLPRRYYFPPVSLHLGYYYHPYFGFYYGPYYGPFYPYPGPYYGPPRYSASAIRTRVTPVETEVYLDGYYAGVADDFDGLFQRLYMPAGEHEIELQLAGYRTFRRRIYVGAGDTLDVSHTMLALASGEASEPLPPPQPRPGEATEAAPLASGDRPASPFGILVLRVEPADAQILLDDEGWMLPEGSAELVIHLTAGWHKLEIRKDGYQPFRTEVELSEGATSRLNVKLVQ